MLKRHAIPCPAPILCTSLYEGFTFVIHALGQTDRSGVGIEFDDSALFGAKRLDSRALKSVDWASMDNCRKAFCKAVQEESSSLWRKSAVSGGMKSRSCEKSLLLQAQGDIMFLCC